MCGVMEELIREEKAEMLVEYVTNLQKTMDISLEKACELLGSSLAEYQDAKKLIEEAEIEAYA